MGLLQIWMWVIEVATFFLILASVITRVYEEFSEDIITKLFNWWEQDRRLFLLCLLKGWKEKQLDKVLIILLPGENSELRESNEENTLLNLLFISMIGLFIISPWCLVSKSSERWWWFLYMVSLDSSSDWRMWLGERVWALSCDLPLSFWRWRWMGIRLAMVLISNKSNVWKASRIHKATLLCIFSKTFRGYEKGALL